MIKVLVCAILLTCKFHAHELLLMKIFAADSSDAKLLNRY